MNTLLNTKTLLISLLEIVLQLFIFFEKGKILYKTTMHSLYFY